MASPSNSSPPIFNVPADKFGLRADAQGCIISCQCEVAHSSLAIFPSKVRDSEMGSGARRQTWHRNQIALHLDSRWSLRRR
jgi:hypothetical protein